MCKVITVVLGEEKGELEFRVESAIVQMSGGNEKCDDLEEL